MVDEIRELYEYNRWANARVREATASLDAERFARDLRSSFPSVRDTLAHILTAEWIWLRRWQGASPAGPPPDWDLSTHEALKSRWREVEAEQTAFIDALSPPRLEETLSYRNTQGTPFAAPLWQLMRHVVNHSTYHRGQITTLLRQLGAGATATDLVLFYRDRERPVTAGSRVAR